jgi:endonuclease-3
MRSAAATRRIVDAVGELYPDATTELHFRTPFELLVATMLSAQSTDARVNMVTPALFARFADAPALARAATKELEAIIRSTGFFRQKAKSLVAMACLLVEHHGGQVPADMGALTALPGVGRKTANVILNTAFGQPTIAVDTHIFRVANRTGLAPGKNVREVEDKLLQAVPAKYLHDAHHWLILHGRYTCVARKPRCAACVIEDLCAYPDKSES